MYILHTLVDTEFQLIRRMASTTVSTYNTRIDLSPSGETVYRDKGYFCVEPAVSMDRTLHPAARGARSRSGRIDGTGGSAAHEIWLSGPKGLLKIIYVPGMCRSPPSLKCISRMSWRASITLLQLRTIQRKKLVGRPLSRTDWELREFWENQDSIERCAWGLINWDRDRNVPSYPHRMVNHREREYTDGKGNHINSLEGFWGYLERWPAASGGIRREKFLCSTE